MTDLPALDPTIQDDAGPFWAATAEHRLVLPRCNDCATFIWYPRGFCPACSWFDIDWVEVPGTGTVYSFSIPRRGQGAYVDAAPYVVAYVELDVPGEQPGPRIVTNIVGCAPDDVAVDQRVSATFHDTASGHALVRFQPS